MTHPQKMSSRSYQQLAVVAVVAVILLFYASSNWVKLK